MKVLLSMTLLAMGLSAGAAQNTSVGFSEQGSELKNITAEELSWRLHVTGEVLVLSADGENIIDRPESADWQFGGQIEKPLESNWRFRQNQLPIIALKQKWTLGKNGKITAEIAQYEDMERDGAEKVKFGKLIREEKFTIKNFAPIDWNIAAGNQKVIVRLTPGIWQSEDAVDVGAMPMSGKNVVIFESTGKLWADDVQANHPSIYFGARTHEGSLFLSFLPFKWAQPIGEAKGGRIRIRKGKNKIILQSETPYVPMGVTAKVYGLIVESAKTDRLNSVRTYSSDKEEEFIKASLEK
jgi:hypothetical protein